MQFFSAAIELISTIVIVLGAGLGVWGAINLLEGYGADNPGARQGIKQLVAGGGVAAIGLTLIPMLSSLFGCWHSGSPAGAETRNNVWKKEGIH